MKDESEAKASPWKPHPKVANLARYEPSGIYFARVRGGGKLIWKSLKTGPSVYNNRVGTLPQILGIGIEKGSRYGNPALEIVKRRPTQKKPILPSYDQFNAFVQEIENGGGS